MDFMKVFDQTVREIKREVNLKVLKVPEIEQKVLDATEDEPWGPHGTVLAEIAQATKKFSDCGIIMNVLWTRLTETGKNWRLVYKSLAVIEYLVAHGSDQAVDDIVEHTFRISSLTSFEYVEPSGKDVGINVRKKAENIVSLLNNKDKIQEVRNKALANREKYIGVSSSGITYKSGADSFSTNFKNNDRYRGFGGAGDNETFKDSYSDKDRYGDDKYEKDNGPKKESRYGSIDEEYPATSARKASPSSDPYNSLTSQIPPSDSNDEDFDDFDPRGTSSSKTSTKAEQVDLFGQNFVGDLLDASVSSVPTDKSSSFNDNASEVDLFADADFVSATPEIAAVDKNPQHKIDLFASNNSPSPVISTTMDFFAMPDQTPQNDKKDVTSNVVDPFASVPLNTFDGSDPFGAFVSHTNNASNDGSQGNKTVSSLTETKSLQKKSDAFQIKSGIWADSLSRGIIDLNITAPKKVNLADVGIVGGFEEKEQRALPSFYMGGGSTIAGGYSQSRVGNYSSPIINDDDFFSSLNTQQNQLNDFQK